jgi:hypothetical protein
MTMASPRARTWMPYCALLKDTTGAPRHMNLSDADKAALEAFLNTFTDAPMLADPKFTDPFP